MRQLMDVIIFIKGNEFPLDGGVARAGETVILKPNVRLTLECPVGLNNAGVNETTVFWSYGAPDDRQSTTVIGKLILPERRKTTSDLGGNRCFDISSEGSLLLTNCSQNGDVRYWCHVFSEGGVLHRYYVDVAVHGEF